VRRIVLAVGLVVLAVACGSGSTGGAAKGGDSTGTQVTFVPDPLRTGAAVTFTVTVANGTSTALDLTFPTGQRADVTLAKGDTVLYQWSRGLLFTQMVGHVRVPAGGHEAFTLESRSFDVPAGTYRLHAVVTASNHMDLGITREVTVRSS